MPDTAPIYAAIDGKAPLSHAHAIGDLPVSASGTADATKLCRSDDVRLSNSRTPTAHVHAVGDTTGLQTALDGKSATGHTHTIANTTGLQAAIDSKLTASSYTAADVLAKMVTVDGPGSGLDADMVDGVHLASLARADIGNTLYRLQQIGSSISDDAVLTLASASGKQRSILFTSGGIGRWVFFVDGSAESGGNVGSDLVWGAYTDAGGWLGEILRAKRATRAIDFPTRPTFALSKLVAQSDFIDTTQTWTPGTIANGTAIAATAITLTGASLGDHVLVACTTALPDVRVEPFGAVTAANTVQIGLRNLSGASQSLGTSLVFNVRVMKRGW